MKKESLHGTLLKVCAYILMAVVILNLSIHIQALDDWGEIVWYCNIAATVCAIGILAKKQALTNAVLITAVPSQFLWIVDFFFSFFGYGFGRTAWLFEDSSALVFVTSAILHALLIPVSLYATIIRGFSKKSFVVALLVFVLILLPLTYLLTQSDENRNCMFYPCDVDPELVQSQTYNTPAYAAQVVLFWGIMLIPSYGVHYFIFKNFGKIT